ncbi:integral membrane protein [Mycobacterium tuberculosis]|uniref:Integral membrane protein n=1 Tax=Mycobacterium tuberculosis TaxID=1773 RepID=A0A655JSA7_MYCTX|nr:integral membrane protein [Mycobacterium tuberculosis]
MLGLIGLVAVWRGLGDDRPAYVGIRALEFSLGEYNLRGALALIAIALAMLAAAKRGTAAVFVCAAVVSLATEFRIGRVEGA